MLERFMAAISVAHVKNIIRARHVHTNENLSAYHHPIADQMFTHLNSSPSGIFVHWGVYESGKL